MAFHCTICDEESVRICVRCTKDTCNNHLCERCRKCSDCCECEVPLDEDLRHTVHEPPAIAAAPPQHLDPDPEPEEPAPSPDPDPAPMQDPAEEPPEPLRARIEPEPVA